MLNEDKSPYRIQKKKKIERTKYINVPIDGGDKKVIKLLFCLKGGSTSLTLYFDEYIHSSMILCISFLTKIRF